MLPYVLFEASSYTLKAPLLPKLRGQFAEFLNDGSLEGLGTFIPVSYSHLTLPTNREV